MILRTNFRKQRGEEARVLSRYFAPPSTGLPFASSFEMVECCGSRVESQIVKPAHEHAGVRRRPRFDSYKSQVLGFPADGPDLTI